MRNSVYDPDARSYRVNFACTTMLAFARTHKYGGHPKPTRKFDTCFEMDDSDEVVARVYRRALKNPKLMEVLPLFLNLDRLKESYEKVFGVKNG